MLDGSALNADATPSGSPWRLWHEFTTTHKRELCRSAMEWVNPNGTYRVLSFSRGMLRRRNPPSTQSETIRIKRMEARYDLVS